MLNYLRVPVINAGKICFAVTCVTFSQSAVCCGRGTTFKCLDDLRIHIWRDLEMFAVYINMVKGCEKNGECIGMSPGKMFGSIGNCTDDHNRFLDVFGLFLES